MNGRQKCRILKEIRAQIARENDISLVIEECAHKGACRGTCPRCESEVAYLERELEKRRQARKRVALAGVSAGVSLALSGCAVIDAIDDALWTARHGGDEALSFMVWPYAGERRLAGFVDCLVVVNAKNGYVARDAQPCVPACLDDCERLVVAGDEKSGRLSERAKPLFEVLRIVLVERRMHIARAFESLDLKLLDE